MTDRHDVPNDLYGAAVAIALLGELADVESAVAPDAAAVGAEVVVEEPIFDPESSEDEDRKPAGTMLNARRLSAHAAVEKAQLYLDDCTVRSPIDGFVTNLNIATGEYANEGRQVFSLIDASIWYVMANFKETYLFFIEVGDEVEVYLMARPDQRWKGVIQGIGWAIDLADGRNIPGTDLPRVDQTFDWVRLAQRFPVRIILEDGPDVPIRMGETAAVIVLPGEGELPPPQFPWLRRMFTDLNLDNGVTPAREIDQDQDQDQDRNQTISASRASPHRRAVLDWGASVAVAGVRRRLRRCHRHF